MQWYFASLAMLLTMVGIGLLTGSPLTIFLPARMQPASRIFLAVPLGWALLTLVAALCGWVGHGYAVCHCALVTAGLSAVGAWTGRESLRRAGGDCVRLASFCLLASFPILCPLWRHGSFSLYNDTYIYISQAQWLQHHGFLTPADTSGGHPAWGQVVSFQVSSLRMGASFLLGWTQAMFGLEWSIELYPALAALGLICGALGVGATVIAACPGRWPEAWLAAVAVAGTANGFAFGAASGFLPQTWGLAFASAAFGLRGLEMSTHAERSQRGPWCPGLPLGICVAASMHCYWDLLPLEGPALACTYLWPWPSRDPVLWQSAWRRTWPPALTCLGLVNLEWLRAVKGILYNISAVVANPVAWSVWDFPAHALGLKSSVWLQSRWIIQVPVALLLIGCAAVAVWLAFMAATQAPARWRHWRRLSPRLARWHGPALIPALTWIALSTLLFLYFRYVVPSPWLGKTSDWPDGVGQSWSQYKLTTWASFSVISVVAALVAAGASRERSRVRRGFLLFVLMTWSGTGMGWNYLFANSYRAHELTDSGNASDPLIPFLAMRQMVATLPKDDWIYLDWPADGTRKKYRELAAYFLSDHPLASDWSDDGYINPYIPANEAKRAPTDCEWILKYRPPGALAAGTIPTLGGMTLERSRK